MSDMYVKKKLMQKKRHSVVTQKVTDLVLKSQLF